MILFSIIKDSITGISSLLLFVLEILLEPKFLKVVDSLVSSLERSEVPNSLVSNVLK